MFIWNMLSLNGMRSFGNKFNAKTMRAWPKADNIISFRAGCYRMDKLSYCVFSSRPDGHLSHLDA
jgi:hypothetical protein